MNISIKKAELENTAVDRVGITPYGAYHFNFKTGAMYHAPHIGDTADLVTEFSFSVADYGLADALNFINYFTPIRSNLADTYHSLPVCGVEIAVEDGETLINFGSGFEPLDEIIFGGDCSITFSGRNSGLIHFIED